MTRVINYEALPTPGLLGPEVVIEAEQVELASGGAVQITLTCDGGLSVRGPRAEVARLIVKLAQNGWRIEFTGLQWCG